MHTLFLIMIASVILFLLTFIFILFLIGLILNFKKLL